MGSSIREDSAFSIGDQGRTLLEKISRAKVWLKMGLKMLMALAFSFFVFKEILLIYFLERGREGEREGEKH